MNFVTRGFVGVPGKRSAYVSSVGASDVGILESDEVEDAVETYCGY